jgi:transposase
VTVGVDLAKNVFQVHAIGADGKVLVRRQLRRGEVLKFSSSLPPCLVGTEACASNKLRGAERFERDDVIRCNSWYLI